MKAMKNVAYVGILVMALPSQKASNPFREKKYAARMRN